MEKPFVSVVTPTYNRRKFIPTLIEIFKAQTYPQDRMEWIVLDDGQDLVGDLFAASGLTNIRYFTAPKKMTIGAKRNFLNKKARGEIILSMDDDDYYMPDRISYTIKAFQMNPTIQLAGCSEAYMYYTDIQTIYRFGPYGPNHATNGTLAVRASYAKHHMYDTTLRFAEEASFLENYKHRMIQLDSKKIMLVISHSENTFNKLAIRASPSAHKTALKLRDFIKPLQIRSFFANA
jgi:glycosyltransferase involved in cell wall biosynthesis